MRLGSILSYLLKGRWARAPLAWSFMLVVVAIMLLLSVRLDRELPGPGEQDKAGASSNGDAGATAGLKGMSPRTEFRDCDVCPVLVVVKAPGAALSTAESDRQALSLEPGLAVGKYEVTFDEWQSCSSAGSCRSNPVPGDYGWGRERRPVVGVSWRDSLEFLSWLSRRTKQQYRLPTAEEWESFSGGSAVLSPEPGDGLASQGPRSANLSGVRTVLVGSYPANALGLCDVMGNVWEWTEDKAPAGALSRQSVNDATTSDLADDYRILRGGSWGSSGPIKGQIADRLAAPVDWRSPEAGFRVVRMLGAGDATLQNLDRKAPQ